MILINGESKEHIEISDRGFQYGDGLFETIEVRDGQAVFLERHLERLELRLPTALYPFPRCRITYALKLENFVADGLATRTLYVRCLKL